MELFVHSFVFNNKKENSYLLWNRAGECLLVDPGCSTPYEQELLTDSSPEQSLSEETIAYAWPF